MSGSSQNDGARPRSLADNSPYAQASIIAPFGYWQLAGAVFVGYLISGYLPDAFTWLGAGIIVCAGIHIAWSETRRRPALSLGRA